MPVGPEARPAINFAIAMTTLARNATTTVRTSSPSAALRRAVAERRWGRIRSMGVCEIYNPPVPLSPGFRLGPYEIVSPLGAGGMGEVYRARDTRLERDVAVKVLPPALLADAAALARFEREAKLV